MAAILVITVKGNNPHEISKNLQIVDNYMDSNQNIFKLYSDIKVNPRIYYNDQAVVPKSIYDITTVLKNDKNINHAVRGIAYSGSLNKL